MKSKTKGNIEITEFFDCDLEDENLLVSFPEKFNNFELLEHDIDEISEQMPLITYLAGYCVHSVLRKLKCNNCKERLTINQTLPIHPHFKYLIRVDRGSLKYPAIEIVNVIGKDGELLPQYFQETLELTYIFCDPLFHSLI